MTVCEHHRLPYDRQIHLLQSELLPQGMTVFDGTSPPPAHPAVLFVPPKGRMYRWSDHIREFRTMVRWVRGNWSLGPVFPRVINTLRQASKREKDVRYVVVFGKTDQEWLPAYERLLPDNVIAVYANNIRFSSPRSVPYPMGRDWQLAARTYGANPPYKPPPVSARTIACYANFGIDMHRIRPKVAAYCRRNPTIDCRDLGGKHRAYRVTYETFLDRLAASWFCICPRGNGWDTYRFWDSLYLGVVPVVLDDSPYEFMPCASRFLTVSLRDLPTIDFDALAAERTASRECSQPDIALDIEYWRTMMFETLRLGRRPTLQEILAVMPATVGETP